MKNFNGKNNKAESRNLDETWRKLDELFNTWKQIEDKAENIETRLGILIESKKHKQEVK